MVGEYECDQIYRTQQQKVEEQIEFKKALEKYTGRTIETKCVLASDSEEILKAKESTKKMSVKECAKEYVMQEFAHLIVDPDATPEMLREAKGILADSKKLEAKINAVAANLTFKTVAEANGKVSYKSWSYATKNAEKMIEESKNLLTMWGEYSKQYRVVDTVCAPIGRKEDNALENVYERLEKLAAARICVKNKRVVEAMLMQPGGKEEFYKQVKNSIRNNRPLKDALSIMLEDGQFNEMKDYLDSQYLSNGRLQDEVTEDILKNMGLSKDASKTNEKNKSKSVSKDDASKKKNNAKHN
jgi:hypothetical protein